LSSVRGGTGYGSYAVGDILYADTTTTLAKLSPGTVDYALVSNGAGVAPSYKQISLTAGVTGTLPIANGGTNATTATGARTNILPSYATNAGKVLAVNVGETDAEWISVGGAGTVTSVSGTGTVSGISLSGTVTSAGSLTLGGALDLSSPPAIGGTTPSTGKFSNLEYTGTFTGGTGVVNIGSGQIYKDASGFVGLGTASPATDLDVVGPASVTSFTGTTKLGVVVRGSTAATDYSGIDFIGNSQTNPTARIAVISTGSGSSLSFGTSSSYASGITTNAMTLNDDGIVGVGTSAPSDPVGFGRAVDIQGSLGGAVYLRDVDAPSVYTYLGFIGSNSTTYIWSLANGPILFGTNDAERMRIASGGAVSIGKTVDTVTGAGVVLDPSGLIRITRAGTTSSTQIQFANNGGTQVGTITTSGSATAYNTSSDYRLKTIDGKVSGAEAKDFIMALEPVKGNWRADGSKFVGFLAHKFQEISPSSVTGRKDEIDEEGNPLYQGMQAASPEVMANLIAFVQEQQVLIQSLTARLEVLENK
jgi:hypothetical protein